MVSIQEVAKEAGVSTATVSRVINQQPSVSLRLKKAVEDAIRKLNYEPNILGRNLRTSSTNMILTLLPSISNPFYAKILQGIQDTARNKGYYILVCETSSSSQIQSFYLNMAKQRLADGIISVDPSLENVLVSELNQSYPVIQCGESTLNESIPYVAIDDELAAYRAVKYLLAIGHTRVALITSNENFRYASLRQVGYEKALKEAKVPLSIEYIMHGVVDYEGGRQAMISLLSLNKPPTAVFAIGDVMAIGALKAVREAGLQVPSDMAVIGFDNIPFSNMTNPTLTTIAQPMYDLGCNAAHLLIRRLTNKTAPIKSIILPHELIIRESTHA